MGTEAALEFLIELVDDAKERFRRDGFFQCCLLYTSFIISSRLHSRNNKLINKLIR